MAKKSDANSDSGANGKRNKLADSVRKSISRYLSDLNGEQATNVYEMVLREVEKPLLEVVMEYCDYNQSKASRALGINRNTLRKKLAMHDLGE